MSVELVPGQPLSSITLAIEFAGTCAAASMSYPLTHQSSHSASASAASFLRRAASPTGTGSISTIWWSTALVHESESGTNFSFAALIGYVMAKDFGRPSSNIRFRMLQAISASASCDSG